MNKKSILTTLILLGSVLPAADTENNLGKRLIESCLKDDAAAFYMCWTDQAETLAINDSLGGYKEKGMASEIIKRDLKINRSLPLIKKYLVDAGVTADSFKVDTVIFPTQSVKGEINFAKRAYIIFTSNGVQYGIEIDEAVETKSGWKLYDDPMRIGKFYGNDIKESVTLGDK
jgi:hypothetical protein